MCTVSRAIYVGGRRCGFEISTPGRLGTVVPPPPGTQQNLSDERERERGKHRRHKQSLAGVLIRHLPYDKASATGRLRNAHGKTWCRSAPRDSINALPTFPTPASRPKACSCGGGHVHPEPVSRRVRTKARGRRALAAPTGGCFCCTAVVQCFATIKCWDSNSSRATIVIPRSHTKRSPVWVETKHGKTAVSGYCIVEALPRKGSL